MSSRYAGCAGLSGASGDQITTHTMAAMPGVGPVSMDAPGGVGTIIDGLGGAVAAGIKTPPSPA